MIEQGLVILIQSGLGSPPIAPGGWNTILPKDQISAATPMAWAYKTITSEPSIQLESVDTFTSLELQIDCHGLTAANSIQLARAVESALRTGFTGALQDPDATVVQGIFREPHYVDGYSDANRSFVRTLEYLVLYNQL